MRVPNRGLCIYILILYLSYTFVFYILYFTFIKTVNVRRVPLDCSFVWFSVLTCVQAETCSSHVRVMYFIQYFALCVCVCVCV